MAREDVVARAEARGAFAIEYQRTERLTAYMTPDEIREAFGLGGTADDKLLDRVVLLTNRPGIEFIDALDSISDYEQTMEYHVTKVDGIPVSDL